MTVKQLPVRPGQLALLRRDGRAYLLLRLQRNWRAMIPILRTIYHAASA